MGKTKEAKWKDAYRVKVIAGIGNYFSSYIVVAEDCAEAEKKVLKRAKRDGAERARVKRIKLLGHVES